MMTNEEHREYFDKVKADFLAFLKTMEEKHAHRPICDMYSTIFTVSLTECFKHDRETCEMLLLSSASQVLQHHVKTIMDNRDFPTVGNA